MGRQSMLYRFISYLHSKGHAHPLPWANPPCRQTPWRPPAPGHPMLSVQAASVAARVSASRQYVILEDEMGAWQTPRLRSSCWSPKGRDRPLFRASKPGRRWFKIMKHSIHSEVNQIAWNLSHVPCSAPSLGPRVLLPAWHSSSNVETFPDVRSTEYGILPSPVMCTQTISTL